MNNHESTNEGRLAISLKNVAVAYSQKSGLFRRKDYWAIKDVSFDLFHGETLGVIGRNGVGKSTLLRLLAGIIDPDKGEVLNYGVVASLLSLQVGFVQYLTGRENAILSGMMLGLAKQQVLMNMNDIRDYADLGEFFDQPVHVYSSGMRARLGMSVAVYANPDVVLLDEVLGVGDVEFREKSAATIHEMCQSNRSVVLVSHQPAMHKKLCDRLIWIEDGCVRKTGDVDSVLSEYMHYFEKTRS
ncbi:MAG: ATP-binding cassette domain-containing protein [Gammaproteobacteria bacterium]|nr:ATP-binding cassette domain-containing protein [Gammaproteobacteria bacterium]